MGTIPEVTRGGGRRWASQKKKYRLRWGGYVARKEDGKSAFKILIGTPTGKRSLGKA